MPPAKSRAKPAPTKPIQTTRSPQAERILTGFKNGPLIHYNRDLSFFYKSLFPSYGCEPIERRLFFTELIDADKANFPDDYKDPNVAVSVYKELDEGLVVANSLLLSICKRLLPIVFYHCVYAFETMGIMYYKELSFSPFEPNNVYGNHRTAQCYRLPSSGQWAPNTQSILAKTGMTRSEDVPTPHYTEWLETYLSTCDQHWLMVLMGAVAFQQQLECMWSVYPKLILDDGEEDGILKHLLLVPPSSWFRLEWGKEFDLQRMTNDCHFDILVMRQTKDVTVDPTQSILTDQALDSISNGESPKLGSNVIMPLGTADRLRMCLYQSKSDWTEDADNKQQNAIPFHLGPPKDAVKIEEEKPLWMKKCLLAYKDMLVRIGVNGKKQVKKAILENELFWV